MESILYISEKVLLYFVHVHLVDADNDIDDDGDGGGCGVTSIAEGDIERNDSIQEVVQTVKNRLK